MDPQFKTPPSNSPNNEQPAAQPAPAQPAPAAPVSTDQNPAATPPAQPPAAGPQAPKSKKGLLRLLVLAAVLVLAGAGAYLALNKVNKPQQTAVQQTKKSVPVLTVGINQPFPTAFYPGIEPSVFPVTVNSQVFEGLTRYQNENQVAPDLATSWTNPNSTTWSFKLAPNVKFHNGHAVDAKAVKASIDALASTDLGQAYGSTIKSVAAKDAGTVEIVTTQPDPLLPNELANLWIYDTTGKTNDAANGTGAYTLKPGTQPSANSIQLVAADNYHGASPLVKELDFKYYGDDKAIAQDVKAGKLDMADLSSDVVDSVQQYGYQTYVQKNPQVDFLLPNSLKAGSPLQKLSVRQAIYEGLDPLAIMKADSRTGTAATQFVPQEIPGYNPDVQRPKQDAAKAKSDLAAAGYPNGFTITFTYYAPHQAMANEVQKEMAAMGIKLTMDPETKGKDLQQKAFGGQTDMFYVAYGSSLIDSSDVISPLLVGSANYKNAKIDSLYKQASTTFDTATRLKLMQQINKLAMDDVAGFPLFVPDGTDFAVKNNLKVHTDNLIDYVGIDFSKVYAQ